MANRWFLIPQEFNAELNMWRPQYVTDLGLRSSTGWAPPPGSSARYMRLVYGDEAELEALRVMPGVTQLPDAASGGIAQAYNSRNGTSLTREQIEARVGQDLGGEPISGSYEDDFNRPDEVLEDSDNWEKADSGTLDGGLQIVSNTLRKGTSGDALYIWATGTIDTSGAVFAKVGTASLPNAGPVIRMPDGVGGYAAVTLIATGGHWGLSRINADGTTTNLDSFSGVAHGVSLEVTADGTTVKGFIDGVERMSSTDSTWGASADRAGVFAQDAWAGSMDDWSAGPEGGAIGDPDIRVTGNGVTIVSGSTTTDEADGTDFGEVNTGSDDSQTFVIHNDGTADLVLTDTPPVDLTGHSDFTVTAQPTTPIGPGNNSPFTIEFAPLATGLREATVSIANNDESPFTFAIAGTGVDAPAPAGGISMGAESEKVTLGYIPETTWGELPDAAPMKMLRFTSEGLQQTTQTRRSEQIRGDRQVQDVRRMGLDVSGPIGLELTYGMYDDLLEAAFQGSWDTAVEVADADTGVSVDDSDGSFNHATAWDNNPTAGQWIRVSGFANPTNNGFFKVASATNTKIIVVNSGGLEDESATPAVTINRGSEVKNGTTKRSFFLEKQFTDLTNTYHRFFGLEVGGLDLNIQAEEYITGNLNLMGKVQETAAATRASEVTPAPDNPAMSSAEDVEGILRGGSPQDVRNLQITLNNTQRRKSQVASLPSIDIGSGTVAVSGVLEAYFESQALVNAHLNYTDNSLAAIVRDTAGNAYVVDIPLVRFSTSRTVAQGKDQDVIVAMNWEAKRHNDENITIRLVRFPSE